MSIYKSNNCTNSEQYKSLLQLGPKSGNREDIINWLLFTDFIPNYVSKLERDTYQNDLDDIIQEVWLSICQIPQEKWDYLYDQGWTAIKAFTSGLIYRQIHSQNSPVYTKYKKRRKFEAKLSNECWQIYEETNTMPETIYEKDKL